MIIEAREDTIVLRGVVKTNIWPAIQAAAALLLENHPTGIIIDCSAIGRITAKGAETFANASQYIRDKNARIVVAGLAPELLEIGKAVPGVRSQIPVCATVEEARASLSLEELAPERGRASIVGMVPMVGDWKSSLHHAVRLAVGENAEIHLVDPIKVPRTLPIGTPLPDREAEGQARLEEAKQMMREARVNAFAHVARVRVESQGLVDFAGEIDADYLVMSLDRGDGDVPRMEQAEAMALLELATFEVSLVKGVSATHEKAGTNVVVPVSGAWDHALEHACKLVKDENAGIGVVSTIVVPRAEPIDAPAPDAEVAAAGAAREAGRIAQRYGVRIKHSVERVRDPILGLMKLLESDRVDMVVVGVRRETTGDYHVAHSIATTLLNDLPCEIVFLRTGE